MQSGGISLIGIQVELHPISGRDAHDDVAEGQFSIMGHYFDAYTVLILESERSRVRDTHMNVAQRADYAPLDRHLALGACDDDPGRVGKIPRLADRRIDADMDGIGAGKFYLNFGSRRTHDANAGQAASRAHQGYDFLGGIFAWLKQCRMNTKLVTGAE